MFSFTKISNFGSAYPINARIFLGLSDIVKLTVLNPEDKEHIKSLLFELTKDLIEVEQCALKVISEIEGIEKWIASQPSTGFPLQFKSVLSLNEIKVFLKYSQKAFRRLVQIVSFLVSKKNSNEDKTINEASFDKLIKFLEKKPDLYENAIKILTDYKDLYDTIRELRNSDEHIDSKAVFLTNYHIKETTTYHFLERPQLIQRDNKPPIYVYEFLKKSLAAMLPFCEELILEAMIIYFPNVPLEIIDIPEIKRDVQCPKRFRVVPLGMAEVS